jgi:hypothetical protein
MRPEPLSDMWTRSVAGFPSKCTGFIFCEFFSNLGATGCRRGRTPERPLRQPSQAWLSSQAFLGLSGGFAVCGSMSKRSKVTNWYRKVLRSQEGCLYGGKRLVSVSLSNGRGRYARGKDSQASDVPAESARPSAELRWTAPCRERPGRSGGGGTSGSLSRQGMRESPGGVKRSQRCISRTA